MTARPALALLLLLALGAGAAECPLGSFGKEKRALCDWDCKPIMAPAEILSIRRGIYGGEVGGAIYEDIRGSWVGVNLDTGQFVHVELHPARELPELLEVKRGAGGPGSIAIRKDGRNVYLVRRRALSRFELEDLACAANRVWAAGEIETSTLTHIVRANYLRDGKAVKEFGESGEAVPLLKLLAALDEPWPYVMVIRK